MFILPPGLCKLQESSGIVTPPNEIFANSLIAWYRADNAIVSDFRVSQWSDSSGNNNHATQSNSSNQPNYSSSGFNDKPVLGFGFNQDLWLQMPNCLSNAWGAATMLVLYNLASTNFNWCATYTGSGNNPNWGKNSSGGFASDFGEFRNSPLSNQALGMTVTGQALVEIISSPTSYKVYRNTTLLLSTTPSFGVTNTPFIGRNDLNNFRHMIGDIAEIIIVDREMTEEEQTLIRAYFKDFWSLTLY